MEWEEKQRTEDGKGVYYESVTPHGRRAYVIQRNRDFPLWGSSINLGPYAPGLDVSEGSIFVGPSYIVKTAKDAMRLCERAVIAAGL